MVYALDYSLFDYIHHAIDRYLVYREARDGHPPPFTTGYYLADRTDQNLLHDKNTLLCPAHIRLVIAILLLRSFEIINAQQNRREILCI